MEFTLPKKEAAGHYILIRSLQNPLAVYIDSGLSRTPLASVAIWPRVLCIDGGIHAIQLGLIRSGHQASLGSGSLNRRWYPAQGCPLDDIILGPRSDGEVHMALFIHGSLIQAARSSVWVGWTYLFAPATMPSNLS